MIKQKIRKSIFAIFSCMALLFGGISCSDDVDNSGDSGFVDSKPNDDESKDNDDEDSKNDDDVDFEKVTSQSEHVKVENVEGGLRFTITKPSDACYDSGFGYTGVLNLINNVTAAVENVNAGKDDDDNPDTISLFYPLCESQKEYRFRVQIKPPNEESNVQYVYIEYVKIIAEDGINDDLSSLVTANANAKLEVNVDDGNISASISNYTFDNIDIKNVVFDVFGGYRDWNTNGAYIWVNKYEFKTIQENYKFSDLVISDLVKRLLVTGKESFFINAFYEFEVPNSSECITWRTSIIESGDSISINTDSFQNALNQSEHVKVENTSNGLKLTITKPENGYEWTCIALLDENLAETTIVGVDTSELGDSFTIDWPFCEAGKKYNFRIYIGGRYEIVSIKATADGLGDIINSSQNEAKVTVTKERNDYIAKINNFTSSKENLIKDVRATVWTPNWDWADWCTVFYAKEKTDTIKLEYSKLVSSLKETGKNSFFVVFNYIFDVPDSPEYLEWKTVDIQSAIVEIPQSVFDKKITQPTLPISIGENPFKEYFGEKIINEYLEYIFITESTITKGTDYSSYESCKYEYSYNSTEKVVYIRLKEFTDSEGNLTTANDIYDYYDDYKKEAFLGIAKLKYEISENSFKLETVIDTENPLNNSYYGYDNNININYHPNLNILNIYYSGEDYVNFEASMNDGSISSSEYPSLEGNYTFNEDCSKMIVKFTTIPNELSSYLSSNYELSFSESTWFSYYNNNY